MRKRTTITHESVGRPGREGAGHLAGCGRCWPHGEVPQGRLEEQGRDQRQGQVPGQRSLAWEAECSEPHHRPWMDVRVVHEDWEVQELHYHEGDVRHHLRVDDHSALSRCEAGTESDRRASTADPQGRGTEIQQLQVCGASPGLEGPRRVVQSQRREPHNTAGAERRPGGCQGGVPGDRLGGPESQPGGGPGGHDHRQGQPRVDAHPDAEGAVHPNVDESKPALHPQGERVDLWEGIAGDPAVGAAAQPNGCLIGGVFRTACANFFHRTTAGFTVDRKTRTKRNMGCCVLLSVVSSPPPPISPPPPTLHTISPACGYVYED
jgi:hypothetical protein